MKKFPRLVRSSFCKFQAGFTREKEGSRERNAALRRPPPSFPIFWHADLISITLPVVSTVSAGKKCSCEKKSLENEHE